MRLFNQVMTLFNRDNDKCCEALTRWLRRWECLPVHLKVVGSIPGQGAYGCFSLTSLTAEVTWLKDTGVIPIL